MPDLEKVIKGYECHIRGNPNTRCRDCPYWGSNNGFSECSTLFKDVLQLLKAQGPVKVKKHTKRILLDDSGDEAVYGEEVFFDCGKCGQRLSRSYVNNDIQYCWHCGQAVKWDE